jgi:hypothetical protein
MKPCLGHGISYICASYFYSSFISRGFKVLCYLILKGIVKYSPGVGYFLHHTHNTSMFVFQLFDFGMFYYDAHDGIIFCSLTL